MAQAIERAGGLALVASAGGRLEPELEAAGGEIIRLPVDSKNPLVMARNVAALVDIVRARGVDIVHARSRAPAWSALIAARRCGKPFVTTYHGVYNARNPLKRFYNSAMARGDIVIANSEYTRAHVIAEHGLAPERIVAIPRGIDEARFDPGHVSAEAVAELRAAWLAGEKGAAPRSVLAVLAARLTRWKGQHVLIKAAAHLESRRPGVLKVVLAGDAQGRTQYEAELRAAAVAAGVSEAIAIVGHVDEIELALSAADVVVAPSLEPEAFGRSAIEAGAMQRPVIAAAHGGTRETIVDGETGLLVPPGDASALATALESLIDMSPDARAAMGARARTRVLGRYTTRAMQAATLDVYDQLLKRRA